MKDTADNKTLDMISAARKRGRPATGQAKPAAERKREQRKRDSHKINKAFEGKHDWSTVSIASLCEHLRQYVNHGFAGLATTIMKELAERAMKNEDTRFEKENDPRNNKYKLIVTVTGKYEKIKDAVTVTESPKEDALPVTVTKSNAAPKYRSAKGETWSGRGQRPAWVKNHIDQGGKLTDLLAT